MPEYLAPGVYIEERPGLRSIEGVSTSTTGFVGMTERGPTSGPPVLVTSFGEFQRQFGGHLKPREDGEQNVHGYLPLAVQHFFDNGGKRAFIVRAYKPKGESELADRRQLALKTGVVARLRSGAPKGSDRVYLSTLRGFSPGKAKLWSTAGATPVDLRTPELASGKVMTAAKLDSDYRTESAFCQITEALTDGNLLIAREPGLWGEGVRVQVRPVSGPPVALLGVTSAEDELRLNVGSSTSFYVGCAVEIAIDKGNQLTLVCTTVKQILGDSLLVAVPEGGVSLPGEGARVTVSLAEIEILVSWQKTFERFRGSWWYMPRQTTPPLGLTPAQRDEFNAARSAWLALHQRSKLVQLKGDGRFPDDDAVLDYTPGEPLRSHPTTVTGGPTGLVPASGPKGQPDDLPDPMGYIGSPAGPGERTGIAALVDEDEIALVAVPGIVSRSVQVALIDHAENAKYRFAVLDGPRDADLAAIRAHRSNFDTSRAALYYPWVQVTDPLTGDTIEAPSSGIVLGVYARSDGERGVFKAPANEVARGALDLMTIVSQGDQEILNPEGINVIRDFRQQERGIRIWGARTLSSDPQWRYVNVRRLFLYIERSIERGTQWVVFEPNNDALWAQVRRTIETFLDGEWRKGALLGQKPEDAFYVRCDRSTMALDDIENGRLVCEIGIAPTRPAEFVIFRIGQLTADARTT
ncbi:phage tail sheath family protein [Sorangium sp. So ce117]|uniref:phage tail sheath family protein n=1 Tax=Sorangium sp. So ce117 TaxID=3133277 RepID=UPI003F608862